MINVIISWIIFGFSVSTGIFVFYKNPKSVVHGFFAIMAILLGIWSISRLFLNVLAITPLQVFNGVLIGFVARLLLKFKVSYVKIVSEDNLKTPLTYDLKRGYSYLLMGKDTEKILQIFTDLVTHGIQGLYISREEPEEIRKKYKLGKIRIFWLSRKAIYPYSLSPNDLRSITYLLKEFFTSADDGVVGIDGIEYLIVYNSLPSVIKWIDEINEIVIEKKARLLLNINPCLIEERDISFLKIHIRNLQEI